MKPLSVICLLLLTLLPTSAFAQVHDPQALAADPFTAKTAIAPRLAGLGDYHFEVTTNNKDSQYFFDQGMRLNAGFNHSEALRSFKEAVRLDPNNAMAYWGWAFVLGPNLNLPMQGDVVQPAFEAMQKSLALKAKVSAREAAYIDAMATRYSLDGSDRAEMDQAYAQAMAALTAQYPDDLTAATLYAAALMNTNPWDYWYKDGSPKASTKIVLASLKSVLERDPNNAGANHYMIHTVESYRPELGVGPADRLRPLMPAAGHLVHMPSHIYMRVGRYKDSWDVNSAAALADERYISQCNAQGILPLAYYPHNIHFQVWSAMQLGNSHDAMTAARKITEKMPRDMRNNPFGLNESFLSQPVFTLARFGQWQDMLKEPAPKIDAAYRVGIWHYGRGLAYNHLGKAKKAKKELREVNKQLAKVAAEPGYGVGFAAAETLLTIAQQVLSGEMAATKGNYPEAISHLEKAVRLQDSLRYSEPPDWYFPVRHILGAVLLEANLAAEAEVIYWRDLRHNPNNGYALFGLKQSLLAQDKQAVAAEIDLRLQLAWQYADVELSSSRY